MEVSVVPAVRVRAGLTPAAELNASCAAARGDVLVAGPADPAWLAGLEEAFRDPRVAGVAHGAAVAFRADLWRERPFRWDLPAGEIAEWAAYWRARGWTFDEAGESEPPPPAGPPPAVAVFVDRFPQLSETFVTVESEAVRRAGHQVTLEARVRLPGDAPGSLPVRFASDETRAERLRALAWLVARHPWRSARDLARRRRWAREEVVTPLRRLAPRARRLAATPGPLHLHAHFAWEGALDALRLGTLLGAPVSITVHAADIYRDPRNLPAKLASAHFATSGCDATVADLRELAGPARAGAILKTVMGVDPERFARRTPHPGGRHVVTVGRLVEKKGFVHLVRAAARLDDVRLTILGEGPERDRLEAEIDRLGLTGRTTLAGAAPPDEIRAALEAADLLCMPSVIAADGDRDSMPVVVKEALAMEVCVVASDIVGLPEIVRAPWGRLVPPGDDQALAAAIDEMLRRPAAERAAAGRTGRAHVLEHANAEREAEKLSLFIRAAQRARAA